MLGFVGEIPRVSSEIPGPNPTKTKSAIIAEDNVENGFITTSSSASMKRSLYGMQYLHDHRLFLD
jgi:hypothetical protein